MFGGWFRSVEAVITIASCLEVPVCAACAVCAACPVSIARPACGITPAEGSGLAPNSSVGGEYPGTRRSLPTGCLLTLSSRRSSCLNFSTAIPMTPNLDRGRRGSEWSTMSTPPRILAPSSRCNGPWLSVHCRNSRKASVAALLNAIFCFSVALEAGVLGMGAIPNQDGCFPAHSSRPESDDGGLQPSRFSESVDAGWYPKYVAPLIMGRRLRP